MGRCVKLLVTPRLHQGECRRAYAWRLASSNGLASPSKMLQVHSTESGLTDLARLYSENLHRDDVSKLNTQIERCDSRYIIKADFRVCPACYKTTPCILEEWQYALLPHCKVHGLPLCKLGSISRLAWDARDLELWSDTVDARPNESVLELQEALRSALKFSKNQKETYRHLETLSANQLQGLVLLIGAFHSAGNRYQPRKVPFKADPMAAAAILESAASCLSDWPNGVEKLLSAVVGKKIESRSIRRNIGYIYVAVQKSLRDDGFKFFREAFYNAIADNWPEVMDSKSVAAKAKSSSISSHVSGTVFAKEMGVSTKTVARWIESKKISGSIRSFENGRSQISVNPGQKDKARKYVECLSLIDAARKLGLKKETVRGLIKAGGIRAFRTHPTAPWQIDKQQIATLMKNLRKGASKFKERGNQKSLDQIMRFYASSDVTQLMIISAIMNGQLEYTYKDGSLTLCRSIHLDRTVFTKWVLGSDLLTISELANELKVKQEVAYHITNKGIIPTVDKGRFGRLVSREGLSEFRAKYIWARDVACTASTSPKKVVSILRGRGIIPVSGPAIDGGRQVLFIRDDLSR